MNSHHKRNRHAVVVVEFALMLPLITMLVLGSLELGRAVMMEHTMQVAAQAGCRVYSVRDSTQAEAQAVITETMTQAGIRTYTVVFDPPTKAGIDVPLEPVSVTVSANFNDFALFVPNYMPGAVVGGACTMPADLGEDNTTGLGFYDPIDDDHVDDGNLRMDETRTMKASLDSNLDYNSLDAAISF